MDVCIESPIYIYIYMYLKMSRAVIKQALELFDVEEQELKNRGSKNVKDKRNRRMETASSTLSSDKVKSKLSKAELRNERLKSRGKLKKSVQDLNMKCVLDEIKRENNLDHSKRNLEVLQYVSSVTSATVGRDEVSKILDHNKGRLARNRPTEPTKEEPKTVFTDADFREFEKTYFCNS